MFVIARGGIIGCTVHKLLEMVIRGLGLKTKASPPQTNLGFRFVIMIFWTMILETSTIINPLPRRTSLFPYSTDRLIQVQINSRDSSLIPFVRL